MALNSFLAKRHSFFHICNGSCHIICDLVLSASVIELVTGLLCTPWTSRCYVEYEWDKRLVNRTWLFWRQLASPVIKLMTNYVLLLLYLTELINGKHCKSNKCHLHCLSYPGATSQIWSFFHCSWETWREREKYRVGASSGNVAACADNNKAFPPVTAAASHEKPRGFVHHWRLWRFLCAVFCFPLTSFRELMVKESLLGMSSELEGLLTCLPAFLLPSLAWWQKRLVDLHAFRI